MGRFDAYKMTPGKARWATQCYNPALDAMDQAVDECAPFVHSHDQVGGPVVSTICTSVSRPATPTLGMLISETDTGYIRRCTSASPAAWSAPLVDRDWLPPRIIPVLANDAQDPWSNDDGWACPRGPAGYTVWGWGDFVPNLAGLAWRVSLRAMLLTSRSTTNKNDNYSNPTGLTNMTKAGDAAATLAVVDDTAALAAAGLGWLVTSGKVYKLDNSAGSGAAYAWIHSYTGDTSKHSLSAWMRFTGAGSGAALAWGYNPVALHTPITHADYRRIKVQDLTPPASSQMGVRVDAGGVVYFALAQMETGSVATHEVLVAGAAATSGPRLPINVAYQVNPSATPVKSRWKPSTGYSLGDKIIPKTPNGHYYQCTTAGTSGAVSPTWPATGTVSDGSVVWTRMGAGLKHLGIVTVMPTAALTPTVIDIQIPAGECAPGDNVILGIWRPPANDDVLLRQIEITPVEV